MPCEESKKQYFLRKNQIENNRNKQVTKIGNYIFEVPLDWDREGLQGSRSRQADPLG